MGLHLSGSTVTSLAGTFARHDSGPTVNVKDSAYGAAGNGTTDDTVAIRTALDYLTSIGGGTLYFPEGTYRVTRILHPVQPTPHGFLDANLTIFKVGPNTRLIGAGRNSTIISAEFVNLAAGSTSSSMHVFDVASGFTAEGIKFKGNYAPGTWAFIPSNNNNAMIGALYLRTSNQNIRNCAFENIPGFYAGSALVDIARFTDNDVRYCANGYNISGRDILVARNTFYMSEAVESAGDSYQAGAGLMGGRIAVVNNHFYDCNIAASLGGNIGTATTDDSLGYVFTGNTIHQETVIGTTPVVIDNNAQSFNVSGNTIYGKFRFGINVTTAAQPATTSPRDGVISGNTIYQTYDGANDGAGAAIAFGFSDGVVAVHGNMLRAGNAQPVVQMLAAAPAEVFMAGNTMFGRAMTSYTGGSDGILDIAPSNVFIPTDSPARYYLAGADAAMTTSSYKPAAHRVPVVDSTSADAAPEFVSRIKGVGSQTDDTIALYKRFYSGKQQWGPTAGGAVDTTLQRVAAGVLGVGSTNAFAVGVTTTAGRPSAALSAGMVMYDSDQGSLIVSNGTSWIAMSAAAASSYTDLGIPSNGDPRFMSGSGTLTANGAIHSRVTFGGSGTFSNVVCRVGTSSGNICVAYSASSGTGISALPGARQQTSGSVACPATGRASVALGGSVAMQQGGWLALAADNATATFTGISALSGTVTNAVNAFQGAAFPIPSSFGGTTGSTFTPFLQGV